VVRAIRAEQGEDGRPTVVAFTANTQSAALDRCLEAGMDDYLTKPTELVTLRDKLARWLGGESALPAPPMEARDRTRRDHPIDRARIEQLVGGREGMAGVLAEVEAGAREDIAALQVALEAADGTAIRRAAHRIKGSARTIGARRLAAAAVRVEEAPDSLDSVVLRGVHALIDELKSVIAATRAERKPADA
jgi:HPt (histidine-containing phosphotransfer) domain-containing protein